MIIAFWLHVAMGQMAHAENGAFAHIDAAFGNPKLKGLFSQLSVRRAPAPGFDEGVGLRGSLRHGKHRLGAYRIDVGNNCVDTLDREHPHVFHTRVA